MTATPPGGSFALLRRGSARLPGLIWPALAYFAVFYVVPLGQLLTLSLRDATGWTGQHFARLFAVPLYSNVLVNTFEIALTVATIAVLLAYPAAYLIETASRRRARLLVAL